MQKQEKSFLLLLWNNFSEKKKHWLKEKFLPVAKSFVDEACTRNQSLFCKKDGFHKTGFSGLKRQQVKQS